MYLEFENNRYVSVKIWLILIMIIIKRSWLESWWNVDQIRPAVVDVQDADTDADVDDDDNNDWHLMVAAIVNDYYYYRKKYNTLLDHSTVDETYEYRSALPLKSILNYLEEKEDKKFK